MPRSSETLEQVREGSRARIMESAIHLFARYGYAGTPVRRIAEDAGVSLGLLYNYFEGKEGLLRAIFERSMEDVEASFGRAARGGSPREHLEELVRAALEIVRENLPFWRLNYQLRMQPGVLEDLGTGLEGWTRRIRGELEDLLTAAGAPDPAMEARVLFATIDGVAQHLALDPEGFPAEEVVEVTVRRFLPPEPQGAAGKGARGGSRKARQGRE